MTEQRLRSIWMRLEQMEKDVEKYQRQIKITAEQLDLVRRDLKSTKKLVVSEVIAMEEK